MQKQLKQLFIKTYLAVYILIAGSFLANTSNADIMGGIYGAAGLLSSPLYLYANLSMPYYGGGGYGLFSPYSSMQFNSPFTSYGNVSSAYYNFLDAYYSNYNPTSFWGYNSYFPYSYSPYMSMMMPMMPMAPMAGQANFYYGLNGLFGQQDSYVSSRDRTYDRSSSSSDSGSYSSTTSSTRGPGIEELYIASHQQIKTAPATTQEPTLPTQPADTCPIPSPAKTQQDTTTTKTSSTVASAGNTKTTADFVITEIPSNPPMDDLLKSLPNIPPELTVADLALLKTSQETNCQAADQVTNPLQNLEPLLSASEDGCIGCDLFAKTKKYVDTAKQIAKKRYPNDTIKSRSACMQEMNKFYCENSYWKDLNRQDRFAKVFSMSKKYHNNNTAQSNTNVDPRIIPCIVAKETNNFEPISLNYQYCEDPSVLTSTSRGLGQVTSSTFYADVLGLKTAKSSNSVRFRSNVPPYDSEEYVRNPAKLNEEFMDNAELQVELITETLRSKIARAHGDIKAGIRAYNGDTSSLYNKNGKPILENGKALLAQDKYANQVYSCYQCFLNTNELNFQCLTQASPGIKAGNVCE